MNQAKHITAFILMLCITLTVFNWQLKESESRYIQEISALKGQIEDLKADIAYVEIRARDNYNQIVKISDRVTENRRELDKKISRGDTEVRRMRATAYDLSVESCGKLPSHPEYGIGASGERVKEWYTCAAGPELPFGTKVYIPFFKDRPNKGIFVVKDRGGSVKRDCIDIYIADNKTMDRFGVKYLEVYILGVEE